MSSAEIMTPKRPRKIQIEVDEAEEERELSVHREKLTEIIKGVFFFDGQLKEVVGPKFAFAKQLAALYAKVKDLDPDSWDPAFYDELRLCLNHMVGDEEHEEERSRVFHFVVVFAIRLFTFGDDALLSFLVSYCEKIHGCDEVPARKHITAIIGIIFKYGKILFKDHSEDGKGKSVSDLRDRLYEMAERRLHDKEAVVRAEVYRAMAPLQDLVIPADFTKAVRRSPTEFILAGLSDISANCRLAALQWCLTMSQDHFVYLDSVAHIATCDTSTKVRREALLQLSKVSPKKINVDQLTVLLHANLTSPDESIRQFTKHQFISVWLVFLAKQAIEKSASSSESKPNHGLGCALMRLMARLNWEKYHEEMVTVCLAGLEVVQRLLSTDGPVGVTEMITFLTEDPTKPGILTRSNWNKLLDTEQATVTMALKAFLWRCFVQYCHQRTDKDHSGKGRVDEAERDTCLTRLAPTLHDMCLLVESVIAFEPTHPVDVFDEETEARDQVYKEMALLDCLEICTFLEQETTGMKKWKDLLEKMIVDTRMPKRITDHIGHVLMNIHYREEPMAALMTVIDGFADASHKLFNPNDTDLDLTVSLRKGNANRPLSPVPEESPTLLLHEIKVVMSILRTGRITEMHPYLRTIYYDLVPKCFRLGVFERKYALEVVGILSCLDGHMATGCSPLLVMAANLDDDVETKVSSLDALCDVLVEYGFEQVEEWASPEEGHSASVFENILKDINAHERLYTKAFECCAKMLLANRVKKAADHILVERMCAMLARIFHPSCRDAHLFKSCATQFLLLFSSISRKDQQLLCTAVSRLLSDMYADSRSAFISEVRIEKACATVAALTHASRLVRRQNAEDEATAVKEVPVHQDFVEGLIASLPFVMDDERILRAHCIAIDAVDFAGIGSEFIAECITSVNDTIDTESIPGMEKNQDLVRLQKRLVALKKMAQKEEDLTKKEGNAPPKAASRRPRQPAKTVNCDEAMLCSPPDVAVTPSPKEAAVGTRTRLHRTAKKEVRYHS